MTPGEFYDRATPTERKLIMVTLDLTQVYLADMIRHRPHDLRIWQAVKLIELSGGQLTLEDFKR